MICLYAFVLFDETDVTLANSMIGKTLPSYALNDSGILNNSESCDTPKSLKTSKALKKCISILHHRRKIKHMSNTKCNLLAVYQHRQT